MLKTLFIKLWRRLQGRCPECGEVTNITLTMEEYCLKCNWWEYQ